MLCRHCGDELNDDCPDGVTSCRGYADWKARRMGDMLTEGDAGTLILLAFYCAWDVALRDGLDLIPQLPP
jgi:hypothetical protein